MKRLIYSTRLLPAHVLANSSQEPRNKLRPQTNRTWEKISLREFLFRFANF